MRAQRFAKNFSFEKAFGSYDEMLADPNIDLVYVATPHSHHYKCMKMCLEAGKNVLCEKAFTVNANQAKEIIELAQEKNLLVAEAIWTRYLPSRQIVQEILDSGVIGEKVSINANFCQNLSHIKRIQDKNLAGGALLDLGIYPLTCTRMYFDEKVVDVVSHADQDESGVDQIDNISIKFEGRKMATINCNAKAVMKDGAVISGTQGYIELSSITNPHKITVCVPKKLYKQTYKVPKQITGFEYELLECIDAIKNGKIECKSMPHSEIIYMMELMDSLRKQWNYEIPEIN